MSAYGVPAFGRLFDQVEILMDFSSPLTDEAGVGWGVSEPGWAQTASSTGVIWTLWLQSRVLRHKEPTLRSQVSDSRRVRKSGDCKPHPSSTPTTTHLAHTPRRARPALERTQACSATSVRIFVFTHIDYHYTNFTHNCCSACTPVSCL